MPFASLFGTYATSLRGSASRRALPLAALALLLTAPLCHAATSPEAGRGVWLWGSTKSPYGSPNIVGHPAQEDATIARFEHLHIRILYGSYDRSTDPVALRAWNRKLHEHGIVSYVIFADTGIVLPERWDDAKAALMNEFVRFNQQASQAERFDGVAFDIEPHILERTQDHPGWKEASHDQRRVYLADLLELYTRTRALLDENGEKRALMEAALPTWFDKLDGQVHWKDTADRDAWFAGVGRLCTVSLMDYEISSTERIVALAQQNRELLHGNVRIALRANLGVEWRSGAEFWAALNSVETTMHQGVDLHDYALVSALLDK